MKKIVVLHLLNKLTCGGMENGVVNLVNFMDSKRFRNIVCSFNDSDDFQFRIKKERRNVVNLYKKRGNDFILPFRLRSVIGKENVDIVHARGWGTYLEGAVASKILSRKKIVFSFHGKTVDELDFIPLRRRLIQKGLSLGVDKILTLSNHMADDYAAMTKIKRDEIGVIYNGVDIEKFSNQNNGNGIKKLREEFHLKDNDFTLGFVGRIDPVKGLNTLIDAVNDIKEKIENLKVLIVGEGVEKEKLRNLVKEKKMTERIIFAGQREDVSFFFHMVDIYVQPSLYEGMSNTIIEAMASGRPVITTRVGGNPEIITHEKEGLLFEAGKKDELVRHILRLYGNAKERVCFSQNASDKVKKCFSISAMVKNYENLYSKLMEY